MYYITNHTNQIIAVDNALLDLLHIENIETLSKQIALNETSFAFLTETSICITTQNETPITFDVRKSSLTSIMGNFTLIQLNKQEEDVSAINKKEISLNNNIQEEAPSNDEILTEDTDDLIFLKNEPSIIKDEPEINVSKTHETEEIFISDDIEKPVESQKDDELELFDLTIPTEPIDTIEEISLETIQKPVSLPDMSEDSEIELNTSPIVINLDQVSSSIGISSEDYKNFLNEYIDTALSLENDLQSTDTKQRDSAIATLTQLAEVLQLPNVNTIMEKLSMHPAQDSQNTIELFYATLSRFTTETETTTVENIPNETEVKSKIIQEPVKTAKSESKGFGTINLNEIEPIHFDFQLEEAANDLSLPVELIEEFVRDFIEQAHVETEKMLQAYEKGDLATIQKIGHLLKGASSNLRINPLSETLYEIQFCEDSNNLDALIKRYWGQFLAFEQHINIISK